MWGGRVRTANTTWLAPCAPIIAQLSSLSYCTYTQSRQAPCAPVEIRCLQTSQHNERIDRICHYTLLLRNQISCFPMRSEIAQCSTMAVSIVTSRQTTMPILGYNALHLSSGDTIRPLTAPFAHSPGYHCTPLACSSGSISPASFVPLTLRSIQVSILPFRLLITANRLAYRCL